MTSLATQKEVSCANPDWQQEGLPGAPGYTENRRFIHIPTAELLRNVNGGILCAPSSWKLGKILSSYTGKPVETISLFQKFSPPDLRYDDHQVFRLRCGGLTETERGAVTVLAWMADNYYPPMKRRDKIIFPTALADLPRELQTPRLNTQMWKIFTEDKAIQVAGALETMWSDIGTTVFEDGDGWFVAIESGEEEVENTRTLEQIEAVLWVLSEFDVVPNSHSMRPVEIDLSADEVAEARKRLNNKAICIHNSIQTMQRIQQELSRIAVFLGLPTLERVANEY